MATIVRQKGLAPIEGTSEVKSFLKERGIDYDHWKVPYNVADLTDKEILADVEKEELLKKLDDRFETLKEKEGYQSRDLIVLHPNVSGLNDMLTKFDRVHYHTDEEVRYIVDGSGVFGFVLKGEKFLVHVVKDDFISVPRNTNHWFYLDDKKRIKAVRYFQDMSGWVPNYVEETNSLD
ncbi:1,2-dihydroxy-3-keto-5-methylthiopentene dioxygenase [Leptospira borgpetersenii]|uniref:1,2-dihydroxy-3-keto-5-methylthiopentene dioxygenase n=1 Tax=Leptospira borgpetersenii TaxID=174 RepID=UPI0020215CC8|nr:cupin domain-containing protein [Leptospira borgpetersenii]URD71619.1 cupin domain-containing protein [Leptospira borgpetersenii]UVD74821.1 cupin domain-containing protein [Leptospira borgpetersenii]UVD78006.1 cupin domain-containing protein [Leptospira borgpetersenii]UZW34575.1 cupin domain-containing protein [Leptospira borgpetersenii]